MNAKASCNIDAHVIEVLMPDLVGHDRRPSAFIVYLYLWNAGLSGPRGAVGTSLAMIAADTGLSKRSVQVAIAHLRRRNLLQVEQRAPTAMARYTALRPWRRASR